MLLLYRSFHMMVTGLTAPNKTQLLYRKQTNCGAYLQAKNNMLTRHFKVMHYFQPMLLRPTARSGDCFNNKGEKLCFWWRGSDFHNRFESILNGVVERPYVSLVIPSQVHQVFWRPSLIALKKIIAFHPSVYCTTWRVLFLGKHFWCSDGTLNFAHRSETTLSRIFSTNIFIVFAHYCNNLLYET